MIKVKIVTGFIFYTISLFFAMTPVFADEGAAGSKEPVKQKTMTVRETEILGTFEKPQFSTDLPWKSPSISNLNAPQPHRSFKYEILRPLHPNSEFNK
jgi:hypothetical protein